MSICPCEPSPTSQKARYRASLSALALVAAVFSAAAQPTLAQTLTTLHRFPGGAGGTNPTALVFDQSGNLYGTTPTGGAFDYGTVFQVTPSGKETVLHSFGHGKDGLYPVSGLAIDGAGNLYGATTRGGTHDRGIVFKLITSGKASGKMTVLHTFTGGTDGGGPEAGLLLDAAGTIYGTTSGGGDLTYGVVFKLTPSGTETALHSFDWKTGAYPYGRLAFDAQGNLYGTTFYGGTYGVGTVFKVTPSGTETVFHSFSGMPPDSPEPQNRFADGSGPESTVVFDKKGNLYGTTFYGGADGYGTVFKVTPSGKETILHTFTGGEDGLAASDLIIGNDGTLYGTVGGGGVHGYGAVYKMTLSGKQTLLYSFSPGSQDGFEPLAGVILDSNGTLYGTTAYYGHQGEGTVFKLVP